MTMQSWIRGVFTRPAPRTIRKAPRRHRLMLEALEERSCPSTFTVTNPLDDGSVGSFRWAVGQANSSTGDDTVAFDASAFSTAETINLSGSPLELTDTTGLTTITGPASGVTINGGGLSRALQVDGGAAASISGMTITGFVDGGMGISGGGVFNAGAVTLTNCTISSNYVPTGGGLYNQGTATLTNCTISGNNAMTGGGLDNQGTATLTNCTISGNFANFDGGGVFNAGTVTLTNCTVSGNTVLGAGGGVSNQGTATLANTIVAGNTANSLGDPTADVGGALTSLGHNLIGDAGGSTGWVGSDLTGAKPLLLPLGNNGGPTQTMALLPSSPAIDAGDNTLVPGGVTTDQRGQSRIVHATVDIGAFESNIVPSLVVNTTVDKFNFVNGNSLREALLFVSYFPGSAITFDPTVFATGQTISLTEGQLELSDTTDTTTIAGPAAGLTIDAGGQSRVFHVGVDATALLSGLTITGGLSPNYGGGLLNEGSVTLTNCTVSGNSALDGGGIANFTPLFSGRHAALTLQNTTVSGNSASHDGGGIEDNTDDFFGPTSRITLQSCTVSGNSAGGNGGGINNMFGGELDMQNCTVAGNSAGGSGGGITSLGPLTMLNSTVAGNSAGGDGGGLSSGPFSYFRLTLNNCLVAGNSSATGTPDIQGTARPGSHNLIGDGTGLDGIADGVDGNQVGSAAAPIDPLLAPLGKYGGPTQTMALQPGSPAVDAGTNGLVVSILPTPSSPILSLPFVLPTPDIVFIGTGPAKKGGPSGLPDNTTFYYRVSAVNQLGETLASTETSITTGLNNDANIVTFSWNGVPGATGYNVYGRTQGSEQLMFQLGMFNQSFTDDGSITPNGALPTANTTGGQGFLPDNTTFYYRVSALNQQGETLASEESSITTETSGGLNTVTVNWGAVPGATGYNVYGRTQGAEQLLATVDAETLRFADDGSITPTGALPTTNTTVVTTPLPFSTDQRGFARIVNGTVDIGAFELGLAATQPQTIAFDALASVTYGDADFVISAKASSGLPVSFTATGAATVQPSAGGWLVHITRAGSATITAHQGGNASYDAAPDVAQILAIAKATLTVSANTASKTYGSLNPTFGATITGFVNGDPASVVSGSPSLTTSATAASDAGAYPIVADVGNLSAVDYVFAFANGTLKINRAALTVSVASASKVYGQDDSAALTGTISGIQNGDPITANYSSAGSGATAAPGTYAIDAFLADANSGKLSKDYDVTILQGLLTVAKDSTTAVVVTSASTVIYGQPVTFTATIKANAPGSGTPTGTVSFYDGATLLGTRNLSGGVATFTAPKLAVGTHTVSVQYSGDSNFLVSTSAALTETIKPAQSAQDLITLLIKQVNTLVTTGVLNSGNGNALTVKLQNALSSLNAGKVDTAVNQLNAFINQVMAFLSAGKLTKAQGQPLIDEANQAIAAAQA